MGPSVQQVAQQMSRPDDVSDPVPNMVDQTQQLQDITDERPFPSRDIGSTEVPAGQEQPVQEQPVEDDAAMDDLMLDAFMVEQAGGNDDSIPIGGEFQDVEPISESFIGANLNVKEQLEVLPARIRASFGKTQKEKQSALETYLGKKNVRATKDNFLVRLPGKDKFRKLDPETFDIIGDMFADTFRDSVTQMTGVAAVAAQGPGALEPVSSAVGYGLGVAAGDSVADLIAENVLGIPRDPSRGGVAEGDSTLAQVEAGAERALDNASYGATSTIFNSALKKLVGVFGDRITKRAELRKAIKDAGEVPEHQKLSASVKANMDTADELVSLDQLKNLPGTDTPILAHQMLPDTKDAKNVAQSLNNSREFQTLQGQASKQLGDTIVDMVEAAADLSQGTVKKAMQSGQKIPKKGLVNDVGELLESATKAEGKLIGEFRDRAGEAARNVPIRTPKTMEALEEIVGELGIQARPGGGYKFLPDDDLAAILGTDSKAFIGSFKKDITRLLDKLSSRQKSGTGPQLGSQDPNDIAGFVMDDILKQAKLIGNKNPAARRVGGLYQKFVGKLSSALRADAREGMTTILGEADGAAYAASMKKFADFTTTSKNLGKLLESETGANTFTRLLLSKGKSGLANLKATKRFLNETNPEAWGKIKSEFFEELAIKHRNLGGTGGIEYNVKAMRKDLAGYGKEFLDEMFPKQKGVGGAGLIFRAMDLAEQVQRATVGGTEAEMLKLGKELARASSQFVSAKINSSMSLFSFFTKDKRLMKLMSKEGIEVFLEKVPEAKKGMMRKAFSAVLEYGKGQGLIKTLDVMSSAPGRVVGAGMLSSEAQQAFSGAPRSEIPR